ncbi:hypothetical protein AWW66_23660 [Micromonospora rosaria]|uniref:Uncharacterized protein n=1 Tax=Micromonospora rosaria TaxID=47874 RepID=A0A136PM96_9ACTN|nr:hypothetical protein [Micromonospora rosaria]KXK59541.1 hypothetical protein AWW66_23660 [Micromonospora rosaria]
MTLHVIAVYHNTESWFLPYQSGHALTQVISHWRHLPSTATPEEIATWTYDLFNVDLDHLETNRARPNGEIDFLTACTYRLLGLRSLSTGDVIAVTANGHTTWLACELIGWERITTPTTLTGTPLTAETVYQHLRRHHAA